MDRLTKFEVSRITGLRALQIENGAQQMVEEPNEKLRRDFIYIATRELQEGKLDYKLNRSYPRNVQSETNGAQLHLPSEVSTILRTKNRLHE